MDCAQLFVRAGRAHTDLPAMAGQLHERLGLRPGDRAAW